MTEQEKTEAVQVNILALVEDQLNGSPILLLHDPKKNRILPIWIGETEACAISIAINKTVTPRPLTHQLLLNSVSAMGGKLTHAIIDRLVKNTYYATLIVQSGEKVVQIDSRPSDAVAIALLAAVPLFVSSEIMLTASQPNPFPGFSQQQTKREMTPADLENLKGLLDVAREREQKSA